MRQHAFPFERELHALGFRTPHERRARLCGEIRVRRVEIDLRERRETAQGARVVDVHATPVAPPWLDRLAQRLRHVGHAQRLVKLVHGAEASARGARALRRVEAEEARLELVERTLRVVGARELLAEAVFDPAVLRGGVLA